MQRKKSMYSGSGLGIGWEYNLGPKVGECIPGDPYPVDISTTYICLYIYNNIKKERSLSLPTHHCSFSFKMSPLLQSPSQLLLSPPLPSPSSLVQLEKIIEAWLGFTMGLILRSRFWWLSRARSPMSLKTKFNHSSTSDSSFCVVQFISGSQYVDLARSWSLYPSILRVDLWCPFRHRWYPTHILDLDPYEWIYLGREMEKAGMSSTVISGFDLDSVLLYKELVKEFRVCHCSFMSMPAWQATTPTSLSNGFHKRPSLILSTTRAPPPDVDL